MTDLKDLTNEELIDELNKLEAANLTRAQMKQKMLPVVDYYDEILRRLTPAVSGDVGSLLDEVCAAITHPLECPAPYEQFAKLKQAIAALEADRALLEWLFGSDNWVAQISNSTDPNHGKWHAGSFDYGGPETKHHTGYFDTPREAIRSAMAMEAANEGD